MPNTNAQSALPTMPEALTTIIRRRAPRASAKSKIVESLVPMRTCYETMTRLVGPADSVLDYAAFLFAEEDAAATRPTPALTVEEAHFSPDTGTLSLVLSRGSFTVR